MPKANEKDVYYFPHDCNARNDDKMLALISVHGLVGYAVYFMIIEILREQPIYKLPIAKYTYNALAMQMHNKCSAEEIERIINDCVHEFKSTEGLLSIEDGFLFSNSLLRRMATVDNTSEARRNAANIRWEREREKQGKCKSNAKAMQEECNKIRRNDMKQEETKLNSPKNELLFFQDFWKEYPKKSAKIKAEQSWKRLKVDQVLFDEIMLGLSLSKKTDGWTKDKGQFIPLPATWLNGERWKDETLYKEMKLDNPEMSRLEKLAYGIEAVENNNEEHIDYSKWKMYPPEKEVNRIDSNRSVPNANVGYYDISENGDAGRCE